MKRLLVLLLLAGCDACPTADECKKMCAPNPVKSFSGGGCSCGFQIPESSPVAGVPHGFKTFCELCADSCGSVGMKNCKFGNGTWGAGPDVCECNEHPDAGK